MFRRQSHQGGEDEGGLLSAHHAAHTCRASCLPRHGQPRASCQVHAVYLVLLIRIRIESRCECQHGGSRLTRDLAGEPVIGEHHNQSRKLHKRSHLDYWKASSKKQEKKMLDSDPYLGVKMSHLLKCLMQTSSKYLLCFFPHLKDA